jgi:signal transduction histidine kinase/ActR/RegA family two-component response regulator
VRQGGGGRVSLATPVATYLPALVALTIILVAGLFVERQSRSLALVAQRAAVGEEVARLGAGLQRAVAAELAAADRLAAHAANPDAVGELTEAARPTRLLAVLAPDGPLSAPETAEAAALVAAALEDSGGPPRGARVVAGPDGAWLLVRSPAAPPAEAAIAAAPIEAILAAAGVTEAAVALTLSDAHGTFALAGAPPPDAVRLPVPLPGGDWTLAAAPAGGWATGAGAGWPIGLLTLLPAALIVLPMIRTRRLVGERQRNIHELRDREAELARLSRRLGLALDASKVGVWDYNIDSDTLVWDERMEELYGYAPFTRGHSYADWRDRLHPDDLARAADEFREAIEVTGRYVSDYRLLLRGGEVRHIRAIGQVFREPDGSAQIVGVNWDVTADVQRNAELEAKRREAEGASVAKSQFLATMSHEIRTPMNGVIGMLDLILRTETDPATRERAEIACESAHHLLQILNDILDLSKLEANRITLEPGPVDVRRLARDVVALMAAGAVGRDLAVTVALAPDLPEHVLCDPTRLRQVIMNLVGNAVKFTEKGRVTLAVGRGPGDRLEVAVHDTGVGIPEAAKRTLFERFNQVDSSVTRTRGGTGLGLAISRQLVELMGGEIAVESVAGLGSTFRFWIPAPAADAAAPLPVHKAPPTAATVPLRVLVAEDNQTNRQILAAYLAIGGHSAHMVANGVEALAAVEEAEFDLVLMDVQMPLMDGLTATRRIRALPGPASALPIVALTANAMHGDRERCLAAGMTEYVAKPVSLDALYAAIAAASATAPRSRPGPSPRRGRSS